MLNLIIKREKSRTTTASVRRTDTVVANNRENPHDELCRCEALGRLEGRMSMATLTLHRDTTTADRPEERAKAAREKLAVGDGHNVAVLMPGKSAKRHINCVAGVQHVRTRDGQPKLDLKARPPPLDEVLLAEITDAAGVHWIWQESDDEGEASEEEQAPQNKYEAAKDGLFAMAGQRRRRNVGMGTRRIGQGGRRRIHVTMKGKR